MPSAEPFASLCFLSYERPEFLATAIESAILHANEPLELVVHDDGSTNPVVWAYLWDAHAQGKISHLMLNPPGHNEGRGVAMNRCLGVARGDVLMVADQDLVFGPEWLVEVRRLLGSTAPVGRLLPVYYNGEVVAQTLVDDDDYELVSQMKWRLLHGSGYAHTTTVDPTTGKRRVLMLHQLLTGGWSAKEVDHRNRRRLDNRRANLRRASAGENRRNVGANRHSTSPFRGVSFNERLGKWVAQGRLNNTTQHIGTFPEELDAAWACEEFRRQHHPDSSPDPALIAGVGAPPIGLLSGFHYWHDPCDWRQTIRARYDGWEEHDYVMGSFMAIPRAAWEHLGPFEERSPMFAEDHIFQRKVTDSGLWVCATPERDLMTNQGFGIGPSTVVTGHGQVQAIKSGPKLIDGGLDL